MKTYFFDLDGTLLDSIGGWNVIIKRFLDQNHVQYPQNIVDILAPLGYRGMGDYLSTIGFPGTPEEIHLKIIQTFKQAYKTEFKLKEGTKEALSFLKKKGHPLYVLSASPHVLLDTSLQANGVFDWFHAVWSSDDFAYTKNQPEIYFQAAARAGVTVNDCIFVDDNEEVLKAVQASGMFAIGRHEPCCILPEKFVKMACDAYVYDLRELMEDALWEKSNAY